MFPTPSITEGLHFADNLWPDNPSDLRAIYQDYFKRMEGLALEVAHIFAAALDLPMNFLDTKIACRWSISSSLTYDAEIKCIDSCKSADEPAKYPPVMNGDYLYTKFSKQTKMELEAT